MPSLLRLLVVLGLLGGLAYAAMFTLANFVQPKPREITVRIPQDRLAKPHCCPRGGKGPGRYRELTIARPSNLYHARLIVQFPDMLAAERAAAINKPQCHP